MTSTHFNVAAHCAVTDRLRRFLSDREDIRPNDLFADWRPADIANVLGGFTASEAARVFAVMPPRRRASIAVFFDPATRGEIAMNLPPREREDLVVRADRLVRRRNPELAAAGAGRDPVEGHGRSTSRRRCAPGRATAPVRGHSGWATGMALDAATAILRRGHRLGVIGPRGLARGLIKVAGWRGRLRRQSQRQVLAS
jgi:hypothetical protein